MKSGKTEDFVDYLDEKIRQIPAYQDPENIFRGLMDLSNKLLYNVPSRTMTDHVSDFLNDPPMLNRVLAINNFDFSKNADVETFVETVLKDAETTMDDLEIEYLKKKIREYAHEAEGSGLEDFVQTSKCREESLQLVRSSPPIYQTMSIETSAGAMKVNMRYQAMSQRQRRREIENAGRLMREGLGSLETAKSKSPVLHYDHNFSRQKLSDLHVENNSHYQIISDEIRKSLLPPYELLLYMADVEENRHLLREARKNLCEAEMHLNFESGHLEEGYHAYNFFVGFYNSFFKHYESIDEDFQLARSLIDYLMMRSVSLQSTKEYFQDTIVAIDEAASLGYRNATLNDRRTRSAESIRRIEDRTRHIDGILALNGPEWINQAHFDLGPSVIRAGTS